MFSCMQVRVVCVGGYVCSCACVRVCVLSACVGVSMSEWVIPHVYICQCMRGAFMPDCVFIRSCV